MSTLPGNSASPWQQTSTLPGVFKGHFYDLRYCCTKNQEFCVLLGQNLFSKTMSIFEWTKNWRWFSWFSRHGFQRLPEKMVLLVLLVFTRVFLDFIKNRWFRLGFLYFLGHML